MISQVPSLSPTESGKGWIALGLADQETSKSRVTGYPYTTFSSRPFVEPRFVAK